MYAKIMDSIRDLDLIQFSKLVVEIDKLPFNEQHILLRVTSRIPERVEFFKLLIEHIKDPEVLEDGQGSALIWASQLGLVVEVKSLLVKGVDPNLNHSKALSVASLNGHDDVASILTSYGANQKVAVANSLPKMLIDYFKPQDLSKKDKKDH